MTCPPGCLRRSRDVARANGAARPRLETLLGFARLLRDRSPPRLNPSAIIAKSSFAPAHCYNVARVVPHDAAPGARTDRGVLRRTESPEELLTLLTWSMCAHAVATSQRREQQRTLLALALLGRPRVLVLDEPTAAVDPEGRQVIRDLIASNATADVRCW